MYSNRSLSPEFDQLQFQLRESKLSLYPGAKIGLTTIVEQLDALTVITEQLCTTILDTSDEPYFRFLDVFFGVVKNQAAYLLSLKSADGKASAFKEAKEFNLEHLLNLCESVDRTRPSVDRMIKLAREITTSNQLASFYPKLDEVAMMTLPFVSGIETDPFAQFKRHVSEDEPGDIEAAEPLLISVRFSTDQEPWANPQVLKPQTQYTINGVIKLSYIPEGYTRLVIRHVSTTGDDFFVLSLPEIPLTGALSYTVNGQVIFKYPQNTFDPPIAIKLMGQLISPTLAPLYPHLIGYDELISQVIDEKTFKYPVGFKKLNRKAWDVSLEIKKDLPHADQDELEHFTVLLSAILNYAGYCAYHGIYKKTDNLSEDDFRDRLIAYLSANPMIGGDIIKEGHVAGGRVEIRYENLIAELKVEKKIADRTKMIEEYRRQPSAYASALASDLSILCILDLTPKTLPPAPAANNVLLIPAKFHGFENTAATAKVAVIVIDGNLKNPSAY